VADCKSDEGGACDEFDDEGNLTQPNRDIIKSVLGSDEIAQNRDVEKLPPKNGEDNEIRPLHNGLDLIQKYSISFYFGT
jgi:hypothetical protein